MDQVLKKLNELEIKFQDVRLEVATLNAVIMTQNLIMLGRGQDFETREQFIDWLIHDSPAATFLVNNPKGERVILSMIDVIPPGPVVK